MKILKLALASAAAVMAFKYATKKRDSDGKSLIDDLSAQAPDIANGVKNFSDKIKEAFDSAVENY
ncbi:hypothetical protein ACVWYG_002134 [Pedobacter sp. UYEF25]